MEERQEFEDIVSDTALNGEVPADGVYMEMKKNKKRKNFKKKKHGVAGFFQRMGEGWKNLKKWKKATISTFIALLLIFSIGFGTANYLTDGLFWDLILGRYNYNPEVEDKTPQELGFENVIDQRVINVALFGIDTRSSGFRGNSDSIMILSLDTEAKTVKIVSVVRDTLVPIETSGKVKYRKINSAYASGGPTLAIKTLNQCFGLDIKEYATVNFDGMAQIIDAVGGIDAELVAGEVVSVNKSIYALNGCIKDVCKRLKVDPEQYYITEPGKHHLNGIQAVAYSRIRKTKNVWGTNNDYGRTDRQRHVMEQLFNKALTLPKAEYLALAKALMPCTETSLSLTEVMGLAWDIMLKSPTFSQSRVPLKEYQMPSKSLKGVGDCVYYDIDYVKELLHAYFYENVTPEDYIAQNGVKKNDWYAQAMGGGTTSTPSTSTPSTSTPSTSTPEDTTPPDSTVPPENSTNPEDTTSKPSDLPDEGGTTEE